MAIVTDLKKERIRRTVLLKPHGSLNWFEGELGENLKSFKRTMIFDSENSDAVYAFQEFREPKSEVGRPTCR